MNQPSIGRIVHYKETPITTWPAMVIRVHPVQLLITVFTDEGSKVVSLRGRNMEPASSPTTALVGDWFWPERL